MVEVRMGMGGRQGGELSLDWILRVCATVHGILGEGQILPQMY
jgi:hypothetical protein